LVVALSLCPLLSSAQSSCVATQPCCCISSLVLVSLLSIHCDVASCLASSLVPSHCMMSTSTPSLAHLPRLDGIDCMARCLLGDVYECICFGLVTVNECVNFHLVMCHRTVLKFGENNDKNNKQSLVTCLKGSTILHQNEL
jgi:hypothetical protein